jgi:hypothetical protein
MSVRVATRLAINNTVGWPFGVHSTIWRLDVEMDVRGSKIAFSALQKPAEFLVDVQYTGVRVQTLPSRLRLRQFSSTTYLLYHTSRIWSCTTS